MNTITRTTRRKAHEFVLPQNDTRKRLILDILSDNKEGLTAEEITDELVRRNYVSFADKNFARPRLTEMKQTGEVFVCGKRLSPVTNRHTAVWKATNA